MLHRFAIHTFCALLAVCLASAPTTAFADEAGKAGIATDLETLTPSADTYLQYHGRLVLLVGTTPEEYRWGGTSCGSRTMSADNVRLLATAVQKGQSITPRYQIGQGSVRCLVGFSV
jgi:hypothetical protein